MIPFLQVFKQPADGSKANDKLMDQHKLRKSLKYLFAAFLGVWKGVVQVWMRVGCKSLCGNGVSLQDPWPLGNFLIFSVWLLNHECFWNQVCHMEWQQKNSFKGNQPNVMRLLLISKMYNSAPWTLQYLATIPQQLSTAYSATFKPHQADLLLFGLLLYFELNCCNKYHRRRSTIRALILQNSWIMP